MDAVQEIQDQLRQLGLHRNNPKPELFGMPAEILLEIIEYLDKTDDLCALVRSCRAGYSTLLPTLYKLDAKHQRRALWAQKEPNVRAIKMSRAAGATINDVLDNIKKGETVEWPGRVHVDATPIRLAIRKDKPALVQALLKHAGRIGKYPGKWTPLQDAALLPTSEVAGVLLRNGARVNERNRFGQTALDVALRVWKLNSRPEDKIKMADLLLDHGAKLNMPGSDWIGAFLFPELRSKHWNEINVHWVTRLGKDLATLTYGDKGCHDIARHARPYCSRELRRLVDRVCLNSSDLGTNKWGWTFQSCPVTYLPDGSPRLKMHSALTQTAPLVPVPTSLQMATWAGNAVYPEEEWEDCPHRCDAAAYRARTNGEKPAQRWHHRKCPLYQKPYKKTKK